MDASNSAQSRSAPGITSRCLQIPSLATLLRLGLLIGGIGLVFSSLLQSWFDIPVAIDGIAKRTDQITRQVPNCQALFQFVLGFGLSLLLVVRMVQKDWTTFCTLIACSMLLVGLAFPYFVMLRDPILAADATWLQMQHDNLTWLGGDINTSAEAGQLAWKSKVYLVDPPRQIAIAPLPGWSAWEVGLDKLDDILKWLGYSNVFCQFARAGWFQCLLGSCLLLLVTLTREGKFDLRKTGKAMLFLSMTLLAGTLVALKGPFGAKPILERALHAINDRDYQQALQQLDQCARQFPVLTQDTNFVRQRGLIEHRMGWDSDHAKLWRATKEEAAGKYDQAFKLWSATCESNVAAIRREALRAIQRFATQDYNSGRLLLAQRRLEFVLHRQPGNVKAIYFLQVMGVRQKNPEEVNHLCDWMYVVASHLNFNTSKILKAASQQNAVLAAAQAGDTRATWERMIGAKKP